MQDLDKFIIKTEDYNPDIYKSANMIINHYWLTGFTVSLVNIIAHFNNICISADSGSITLNNQTYTSEVKYLKKDRTLTVKESTFGDVSRRPNVYVIPMIIPEKDTTEERLVVYLGNVQKMADRRSSVPSTMDSSTGKNKNTDRTYSFDSYKLNECIIGALVMKNLSQDILNGFVQFYNTISRMYKFYYKETKDNPEKKDEALDMLYKKIIQIIDQYNKFVDGIFKEPIRKVA